MIIMLCNLIYIYIRSASIRFWQMKWVSVKLFKALH